MSTFNIKKILVPLDFSKTSVKALDYAIDMAEKCNAELTLLHVAEGFVANAARGYYIAPSYEKEYEQLVIKQGNDNLNDFANGIKKVGVTNVTVLTTVGRTHSEILKAAKKTKADIIIMGTHGVSGVREFFIGSNTFNVIRNAKCPVLSVQTGNKAPGFKNVLLPFRGKGHSREKVNYAIDLALLYKSTIHILGVDTEFTEAGKRKIELEAEQIKEIAKHKNLNCTTKIISHAYVSEAVLKNAQKVNADLIIIMSDLDKMDITEYFAGPFSQQIVNHSTIPVLSIHPEYNPKMIDMQALSAEAF